MLSLFFDIKTAAQSNSRTQLGYPVTTSLSSPENVIYKPFEPPAPYSAPTLVVRGSRSTGVGTSLRANRTVGDEALRGWLDERDSPLAPFTTELLASEYWSTILGICTIEQYSCTRLPHGTNWNLWGIMKPGGGLQFYATAEEGIAAIHSFLQRAETLRGRPTIESFRGWYCYSASDPEHICRNWEPVVLRVKAELESL